MKVLAIGATGSNAGLVVPELVKRGVEVRGLVRDPATAPSSSPPPACTAVTRSHS